MEETSSIEEKGQLQTESVDAASRPAALAAVERADPHPIVGSWAEPKNLLIIVRYKAFPWIKKVLTHGTSIDIHALQVRQFLYTPLLYSLMLTILIWIRLEKQELTMETRWPTFSREPSNTLTKWNTYVS